ncbi:MAG: hypothetical protein Q7R39_01065 [Dehalococcoidia bacterium]|nr:hypothetical protein [Dehalococcoidia bacterium]
METDRFKRIAGYALTRPEAYVIVVLVFLVAIVDILGGWPGWIIAASLVAGAALLGLLVLDSLSDPNSEREASIADVEAGKVRDPALRNKILRALEYVRAAQKLAKADAGDTLGSARGELPQLEQAVRSMFQMAIRLQDFQSDRIVQRDLADLRRKSEQGSLTDEQKDQLDTLNRLDELVRSADREVDGALAVLGRSYAEMQTIRATPELRGQAAAGALEELDASSKRLSELAEGYDQVFGSRVQPGK